MNITCNIIEVILKKNCKSVSTQITPKTGYSFKKLSGFGNVNFSHEGKRENGNVVYEQKLNFKYKYDTKEELMQYSGRHLILKIQNLNEIKHIWGNLENPVQVNIEFKNEIAILHFFRKSIFPES